MAIDSEGIIRAVTDKIVALKLFRRVNRHEPKNAPGSGMSCAVWVDIGGPVPLDSGMAKTSARLVINVRIYLPMLTEPLDDIDPAMSNAADKIVDTFSGAYSLSGQFNIRNIDLLGAAGIALSWRAGYIEIDRVPHRTITIFVPVIINDAWAQVP